MQAEESKTSAPDWLIDCGLHSELFAKVFMKDRFTREFSPKHIELFNALDDERIRKLLILAHRGFGKTTCIQTWQAQRIVYRKGKFIVTVSLAGDKAAQDSINIKTELENNRLIVGFFGDQKGRIWSQEDFVTEHGVRVLARGTGQQMRGQLDRMNRPDTIIIDDCEDRKLIKNEMNRAEVREWLFGDVLPMVDMGSDSWRAVVIGTPSHQDSITMRLKDDPSWTVIEAPLCDENLHSHWPEYMTDAQIVELMESLRRQDMIDVFYREYMLLPVNSETCAFKESFFRRYRETDEAFKKREPFLENFILVDPAKTANTKSAHSAIGCVGLDREKGMVYLRDLVDDRLHPEEIYDVSNRMARRFKARAIGVEDTGLNLFIRGPFENFLRAAGSTAELVWLAAKKSKEERVAALAPYYRKGAIMHNATCCASLEQQLLSFPHAKRWDAMDMFAYMIEMTAIGRRFFLRQEDEGSKFDPKTGPPTTDEERRIRKLCQRAAMAV